MKYNEDLYIESERLCNEQVMFLKAQESQMIELIKEMLNDVLKYYSKSCSTSNNYCLAALIGTEINGNSKYYNLIASIVELGREEYFRNSYAINIIPKGIVGCYTNYKVEWDYNTYYNKIREERDFNEKSKFI